MELKTKRLIIRNFLQRDLQDLHEIFGDEETMESCEPAYTLKKQKSS